MSYTYLEDFIINLYKKIHVDQPHQLNIQSLSKVLDLNVYYADFSLRFANNIALKRSTKQKEWQLFGHEVGHYLIHVSNHLNMHHLFMDLQERQANLFAYHFCVPTFMLEKINDLTVYDIMNQFNVEPCFAERRLEMYKNKCIRRYCDEKQAINQ